MSAARDVVMIDFFKASDLQPARVAHRHDGTVELTWHVDNCDERYVRLTSSARGDDCVLVARDLRVVESAVLGDLREIHGWVLTRLQGMVKKDLNRAHGAAAGEDLA